MLQFRDKTNKYIMLLGALFFLFISSSTQACVLLGHASADSQPVNASVQSMHHHAPAQDHVQVQSATNHFQQIAAHPDCDGDCCQLVPADLNDLARAQVSNLSAQQFSSDWFHLQFTSALYSSFYSISFAQREIISPPPQTSSIALLSPISSLNAGRAPPSTVLA